MSSDKTPADSLTAWVKQHFELLFQAVPAGPNEPVNIQAQFDATFSHDVDVVVNHEKLSRDGLKDQISSSVSLTREATVIWKDTLEIPASEKSTKEGIVAGFFVVDRRLRILIHDVPELIHDYHTFSVKIKEDSSASSSDRRRITQIFLTNKSEAAPIQLQGLPTS